MKRATVQDAVGEVLAQSLRVPEQGATREYLRGQMLHQQDIDFLLAAGIREVELLEIREGILHEDEAALRVADAVCGEGVLASSAGAGNMPLRATAQGLLKIDIPLLSRVNEWGEIVCATLHTDQLVECDQIVGGIQVIPLVVEQRTVGAIEAVCEQRKVLSVLPLKRMKVGLIITGSDVVEGKLPDEFGPLVTEKFHALGSDVVERACVAGEDEELAAAILEMREAGVELIAVTGGMSVQPDDHTPMAIRKAGGKIVSYGGPVMPGALFLLAYLGEIPILGLPGCVIKARGKGSLFDVIVPRLLAGETLTRQDFKALAHGGLCRNCETCVFPACSFGKA